MKKNHLKNSSLLLGLIPLAAGVMLMLPACKKTEGPKTDAVQTASGPKLATHTSSANADAAFL